MAYKMRGSLDEIPQPQLRKETDLAESMVQWGFSAESPEPAAQARVVRARAFVAEFKRLTASKKADAVITMPQLVGHVSRFLGMDPADARAAFQACDIDESGMLNVHEYVILREALTSGGGGDPCGHDEWAAVRTELQARALFFRYSTDGAALTATNRAQLVRRLAAGEHHVSALLVDHLEWNQAADNDDRGPLTLARFVDEVAPGLGRDAALSVDDFVTGSAGPALHGPPVVLDPRCLIVERPGSLADDGGADAEAAAAEEDMPEGDVDVYRIGSWAAEQLPVFADDCIVDQSLRCEVGSDWRGSHAAPRETAVTLVARKVLKQAWRLAKEVDALTDDVLDRNWMEDLTDGHEPMALQRLFNTDKNDVILSEMTALAKDVQRLSAAEPRVLRVHAPARVFGDIHGQLRDLLLLFADFGFPHHSHGDVETVSYVFNGNFIDHGHHQAAVVAILFALKVMYPARIALVRGSHEFEATSKAQGMDGFREHLSSVFGGPETTEMVHEYCFRAFSRLPLAAVIDDAVLVIHSGIGSGDWGLADLAATEPTVLTAAGPYVPPCITEAMWSYPADADPLMQRGVHDAEADVEMMPFSADTTREFCAANGIQLIIRSHQWVPVGFKIMHEGRLVTLFSARNYAGEFENCASTLLVATDEQGRLRVRPKTLYRQRLPPDDDDDDL
mmetsp:Transcript_5412/g.16377  ORF Transcript_5412/g.16377 Transcript_5412/m.16377 type:complete len:677 (+) Transcript_5412:71-2101(+)